MLNAGEPAIAAVEPALLRRDLHVVMHLKTGYRRRGIASIA